MIKQRSRRVAAGLVTALAGSLLFSLPALAEEAAPVVDTGDTAWMLTSTALVLLMTAPGLALFYGGLVRQNNILSTMMHSFFTLCLISVVWVLWGYTLAFGTDAGGVIGGLDFLGFKGVGQEPNAPTSTIPHLVFAMYQATFAVITVGLISGAYAERMKFSAYILFSILWATLVYFPLAHWVWGGGWLMQLGALDFAGGTVVHISSGVSALAAALVLGRRLLYPQQVFPPHNLPFTVIGASLLWFGWFGFNAGSALASGGLAGQAFATTNTATAAAALAWTFVEWFHRRKPTALGAASGAVAGLVAITLAAGFVTVPASLAIGAGGGILCYLGVNVLKARLGYDDALDVFGVHGIGGTWGALATGLFATKAVNPAGADGLFYGNAGQLVKQLVGVGAGWGLAIAGTLVCLGIVRLVTGLRVTKEEEMSGLDISQHGESAYNFLPPAAVAHTAVHAAPSFTMASAPAHSGAAKGAEQR